MNTKENRFYREPDAAGAPKTGGQAFPCQTAYSPGGGGGFIMKSQGGMTLRDYFAAKAMQAAATNQTGADGFTFEQRAEWAYSQADAMLTARGAGGFGSTGA